MTAQPAMPNPARTVQRSIRLVMRMTGGGHRHSAELVRKVIHTIIDGYEEESTPVPPWLVSLRMEAALEEQKDIMA